MNLPPKQYSPKNPLQGLPQKKGKKSPPPGHPETEAHAKEVKAIGQGKNILEKAQGAQDKAPQFNSKNMLLVRTWLQNRPLECGGEPGAPGRPAAALVVYPRLWSTIRGRYTKFKATGAGVYAIVRSRPTF